MAIQQKSKKINAPTTEQKVKEGGMVEVGLSDDVIPKLTVNFKAKKIVKPVKDKVKDEKTS